jgi:hypothetical protein
MSVTVPGGPPEPRPERQALTSGMPVGHGCYPSPR